MDLSKFAVTKTLIRTLLFSSIFFISTNIAFAGEMPTVEQLVTDSHLVLKAQIITVQREGEPERIINILVHDTLKGNLPLDSAIEIDYKKPEKGDINFGKLRDSGHDYLFFIRGSRREGSSFRLTDDLYGVQRLSDKMEAKIRKIVGERKKRLD